MDATGNHAWQNKPYSKRQILNVLCKNLDFKLSIFVYIGVCIYMFIGHENIRAHKRGGSYLQRAEECKTCDMETEGGREPTRRGPHGGGTQED